ncbi:hypothetical protein [Sulfitobacter sp.]|jgi:hypothetical protein|uniref:hypothetical protein n=1 Tax=Sulfitobacter sp. TaxID=1903071 RepID=UPI000C0DB243|nr:hypothetical protein [Roseobacter sp.]MBV50870.1 hypothetical protein [Roseobacter sp.]PHR07184.1 MAG: hypothetical protein COB29_09165 [Sulfitobacter sp.]|tara:strand:+ start:537 stop:1058 length:522 start_codon:yes stop_codon:yes gene_type:complete
MRKTFSALLLSTLVLTGCATVRDSRVNPFNWFGKARSAPIAQSSAQANPLIPQTSSIFSRKRNSNAVYNGRPVDQITDLTIERVPGGILLRATGLAARQGLYDVQLVPQNKDELPVDGVLTYRLEGVEPASQTPIGAAATREVIVARTLTDQQLAEVHTIRIEGQRNALTSSR